MLRNPLFPTLLLGVCMFLMFLYLQHVLQQTHNKTEKLARKFASERVSETDVQTIVKNMDEIQAQQQMCLDQQHQTELLRTDLKNHHSVQRDLVVLKEELHNEKQRNRQHISALARKMGTLQVTQPSPKPPPPPTVQSRPLVASEPIPEARSLYSEPIITETKQNVATPQKPPLAQPMTLGKNVQEITTYPPNSPPPKLKVPVYQPEKKRRHRGIPGPQPSSQPRERHPHYPVKGQPLNRGPDSGKEQKVNQNIAQSKNRSYIVSTFPPVSTEVAIPKPSLSSEPSDLPEEEIVDLPTSEEVPAIEPLPPMIRVPNFDFANDVTNQTKE